MRRSFRLLLVLSCVLLSIVLYAGCGDDDDDDSSDMAPGAESVYAHAVSEEPDPGDFEDDDDAGDDDDDIPPAQPNPEAKADAYTYELTDHRREAIDAIIARARAEFG